MTWLRPLLLGLLLVLWTVPAVASKTSTKRVLFVLTNHGKMGTTGKKTGFFWSEFTHVYHVLHNAGFAIDLASPLGGKTPIDGLRNLDKVSKKLYNDKALRKRLNTTIPLSKVKPGHYHAVYFPGGHGTMWDFPNNANLATLIRQIYEKGGLVAAVCHGPAALVGVKLSNGTYLVAGKKVASFTDSEERAVKLEKVVPFLLASKLKSQGAVLQQASNFQAKIAVDGRLLTGQNPASATPLAHAIVKLLKKKK